MRKIIIVAGSALLLAGCSSFQGQPYSVFGIKETVTPVVKGFAPVPVVKKYYKEKRAKGIEAQRAYRDQIISLHMIAIDAQYDQFLRNISMQNKGGNSLVDIASLGLSAAVPLFNGTGTKDALGAGSTFLSGSQGKVNARVFYEATLPAIISIMESQRIAVQADILRKKKADTSKTRIGYDIGEALMDLSRYENAVSIDKAVSILNQKASADLNVAQEDLDKSSAAPSSRSSGPGLGGRVGL